MTLFEKKREHKKILMNRCAFRVSGSTFASRYFDPRNEIRQRNDPSVRLNSSSTKQQHGDSQQPAASSQQTFLPNSFATKYDSISS